MHDEAPEADDAALPPADMLALLDAQRRSIHTQMAAFVPVMLLAWGVAWLIGFGALWLVTGLAPAFSVPQPVATTVFALVLVAAIAVSAVLGARAGRGVRGNAGESFAGAVYGSAWSIGTVGIFGIGQGLQLNGMDPALATFYYPCAFVFFAGIMYVFAAALWRAVPMLILGIWTVLVAAAAPFFGSPGHNLVFALAGGLVYLGFGGALLARDRRVRGRVPRTGARRG